MFTMIRQTEENRGFVSPSIRLEFWVLLSLFLIWILGATSVTIEETIPDVNNFDIGSPAINTTTDNPQILGSNASNSLTDEDLRSFNLSERRKLLGANADTATTGNGKSPAINYKDIPRAPPRPNSPPNNAANPYHRGCNAGNKCRQGNEARQNGKN